MAKDERTKEEIEFEELVSAALKVDPKGLSGKHRTKARPESQTTKKD